MLNKVILIGRLAQDPELRYTPSGVAVANFTVAVQRSFANQQGERDTDFIRVVAWRKLAETCANNLAKGRLVAIDGRLQVRSYEGKDGQRRQVAEVVAGDVRFLDSRRPQAADMGFDEVGSGLEELDLDSDLDSGEDLSF
ncbi:MAG: single-stranded DNA-binding protein [Clostridia bacterium]|nr:MAG: single-stranded DNA-binding protein [Clostridia bacterium]